MALDPELQHPGATATGAGDRTSTVDATRVIQAVGLDSTAVLGAPVAIYAVDRTGTVRSWNRAAEELFGPPAAEVIGRPLPFDDVPATVAPDGNGTGPGVDLEALATALQHRGDLDPVPGTGGRPVHLATSVTVHRDDDGRAHTLIAFTTDVTAKRSTLRALERSRHTWRHLLANASDAVAVLDAEARVLETAGQVQHVLGYDPTAWPGRRGLDIVHPDDLGAAGALWGELLAHPGDEHQEVLRVRHADGHYEAVEVTGVNLLGDPSVGGVVLTARTVTAERQAEALLADETRVLELIARDASLDETLPAIVEVVERHCDGATCLLRVTDDGRHLEVVVPGSVAPELLALVTRTPLDATPTGEPLDVRRAIVVADYRDDPRFAPFAARFHAAGAHGGWSVPVLASGTEQLLAVIATYHSSPRAPGDHEREVASVAAHLASIAIDRDRWRDELVHQARHHHLTGLPNRGQLLELLEAARARAQEDGSTLGVLFLDLDRFKLVNDSLGHAAGDRLLTRLAGRLRTLLGPGQAVGHFGADEFVIIVEDVRGDDDLRRLDRRLREALAEPFALDEGEAVLSASVGVALSLGGRESSETLLQHADAAMYRAKELGRDRTEVFDHGMRTRAAEQLRIDQDLRAAIGRGELAVHFQPEVDLRTRRVVNVEALLRWDHPTKGLVLPAGFLDVAEETGTIVRIGRWVLDEAVRQATAWAATGQAARGLTVSVNLSPRQLATAGLVDLVAEVLGTHGWPADRLVLELNESFLIEDHEDRLTVLTDLKDLGVQLALDDFGTGYSSLNYLHRFPVDLVKIDRSFVTPLQHGPAGSPVTTAVLTMARTLGVVTTGEGVETPEQLAALEALGCDRAQGFLFCEPRPAAEVGDLLGAVLLP